MSIEYVLIKMSYVHTMKRKYAPDSNTYRVYNYISIHSRALTAILIKFRMDGINCQEDCLRFLSLTKLSK